MSTAQPVISVVMPSFNQAKYIEQSIRSVLEQGYPHKQLIVMDGGSTDGAREVIERYADHLHDWYSGPDKGQSDAINRGFERAGGDLLCWLNSDDILLPGALAAVADLWQRRGQPRWIAGNCVWSDPEGRIINCARGMGWSEALARRGLVGVSGPTSFFAPSLLDELGAIDVDLHYAMDTELWIRFARAGVRFARLDRYLWVLRLHPEAKMSGHNFEDSPRAAADAAWRREADAQWRSILERHGLTQADVAKAARLSRMMRLMRGATPRARLDLMRIRGKHWQEAFGTHAGTLPQAPANDGVAATVD